MTFRRFRLFTEALCIVCLGMPASLSWAADGDSAFTQHYSRAMSLYSDEEYEAAIHEFEAAYEIRHRPALLFNVGQAYRKLGHAEDALIFYRRYQALEPNPKPGLRKELEAYIAEVQQLIDEANRMGHRNGHGDAQKPDDPPTPQPPPPPPPPLRHDQEQPLVVAAQDVPAEKPHRPLYKSWKLWTAIGGVVVAGAVVAGIAVAATSSPGDRLPAITLGAR